MGQWENLFSSHPEIICTVKRFLADACDVRKGLRESMRGIWAGDEDLGDGSLQVLFDGYKARCTFVKSIGSAGRSGLVQADVRRLLLE